MNRAGGLTVRKAQFPSGRRMTQEANADSRKGDRKPVNRSAGALRRMVPA
jgi:hypothetical protein